MYKVIQASKLTRNNFFVEKIAIIGKKKKLLQLFGKSFT
jgi:hypothetical protein